jgi:hypothetical protein
MRKNIFWYALLVVALLLVLAPDSALAAPGGKIASGLFKSTGGKILLVLLCVVLSPIIFYVLLKEHFAERRTLKQLARLKTVNLSFDWVRLKERVTDCYHRVHAAWRQEAMSEAAEWMTSWYWQNQQLAYLNQWERDGLVNHCRVKSLGKVRPLYLTYEVDESGSNNGSRLVVSITANMEDYLAERATGKIVEGAKGFEDTEHVWTFELREGKWVVANIEEGSMSLNYAKLKSELPEDLRPRATASASS